nr:gustatory receptor 50 [Papilio dardanus]
MISDTFNNILSLKNHIQPFIWDALYPFIIMQYIKLSPMYSIRGNFISPNRFLTNVIFCLLTAAGFVCFIYFAYASVWSINKISPFLLICFELLDILYALGFLVNAAVVIYISRVNVDLVIRLGKIQNNLKMKDNVMRRVIIENWILCFLILLYHLINTFIQIFYVFTSYVLIFLTIIIFLSWDVNIIYAARMMCLLRRQTDSWILNMKSMLNGRYSSEMFDKFNWQALLKTYLIITDSYTYCERITESPIIYHVIIAFAQFIIHIQTLIDASAYLVKGTFVFFFLFALWIIKHTVLMLLVCFESEKLYTSLKNSQVVCFGTIYGNHSDFGRLICKRLRKDAQCKLQPITARGLFTVNLTLPLNISAIVVTYMFVMLQFNFL